MGHALSTEEKEKGSACTRKAWKRTIFWLSIHGSTSPRLRDAQHTRASA